MGLKVDTIQNPSSATVNLTLDTSGNATVGNNLTVTGTTTFTGSLGNITAGTVTASGLVTGATGALYPIVQGTAQASTSGTSITFTGIPSWVKSVNVIFSGVSTTGTSGIIVRLGTSGGVDSTGYSGVCGNRATETFFTTSFIMGFSITAADTFSGQMFISNVTGNTWSETSILGGSSANAPQMGAGTKALSGALDRVVITTVNGTDTFDAGLINIQYE
jgi:hypothetical protein